MTTAELIRLLQEADPDGTNPVCVGNEDVYFVQVLPAYYDGPLQQLVHDETKRGKEWSIVGARLTQRGMKVDLRTMSIRDVFLDTPDMPVEIDGASTYLSELVGRWRREAREVIAECDE